MGITLEHRQTSEYRSSVRHPAARWRAGGALEELAGGVVAVMPLYLDTHYHVPDLTAEAIAEAHLQDLAAQDRHGVRFLRYWFDETTGKVYCLAEAPTPEAMIACHREAHGVLADETVEVREGS